MVSDYAIKLRWETGAISVEPLDFLGKDNLVELTAYGKKHNLIETGVISVEPLEFLGKGSTVERTSYGKKHYNLV